MPFAKVATPVVPFASTSGSRLLPFAAMAALTAAAEGCGTPLSVPSSAPVATTRLVILIW